MHLITLFRFVTNKSDIFKTKGKLKILKDYCVQLPFFVKQILKCNFILAVFRFIP